jgi:hypothetical protein
MQENHINKFGVLLIVTLQLIIAFCLYIALKPQTNSFDPDLRLNIEVHQRISGLLKDESNNAKELSQNGRHIEAAILYSQIAAARQCLFPEQQLRPKHEPTISEIMALRQFQMANKETEPYKQILQWKYPNWKKPDMDNSMQTLKTQERNLPDKTPTKQTR